MKFEDLKFVRLTQPDQFNLIPRFLFEQVKGSDFKIDRLYQYGPMMLASPLTFFYILAEKEQLEKGYAPAKGILWLTINPFEEIFYVDMLSVDKDYQGNGTALKSSLNFIRSIPEYKTLNPKIIMMTRHVKAFEKAGWERSEKIRMENNNE